ncbi:S-layer homology domain-containing protein [Thiolapillus sp.]
MKNYSKSAIAAGILSLALTGAASAADGWEDSASEKMSTADSRAASLEQAESLTPNAFGTQVYNKLQIPASAFSTRCGDTNYNYQGNGYVSATAVPCGNSYVFWAPVQLPAGALIKWMDLFYYDTDTTYDLTARLHAYTGSDPAYDNPGFTDLASVSSSGSAGYGYVAKVMNYTVNNDVRYNGGAQLSVILAYPNTSTSLTNKLRFKAIDIWWQRQVSPAPATATFNDVSSSHPFFQYIEALAASGITSGCSATNYCPDDPLTRGQMAVFLSKALGLHWTN